MFKGGRKYAIIGAVLAIIIIVMVQLSPEGQKYKPDYRKNSKQPYGCYILFERLNDIFPGSKIETLKSRISTQLETTPEKCNYVIIADGTNFNDQDFSLMYGMVSEGSNCFIATNSLPYNLSDSMGVGLTASNYFGKNSYDTTEDSYRIHFTNPYFSPKTIYSYETPHQEYTFEFEDTTRYEVLAVDQKRNPVFVRTKIGNGYLYLHSLPIAFTNYHLLHLHNDDFAAKCLSYLPTNRKVFWDEYYKVSGGEENVTDYDYVFQYGSLVGAIVVTILGMLLYTLLGMKRNQRIIPIKDEFKNTSYEFVSTIGRLYFNKADHTDLFRKKVMYWREYLRTNLLIENPVWTDEIAEMIAIRSGIDNNRIKNMVSHVKSVLEYGMASPTDIQQLHHNLDYFYKNTKR